MTITVSFCSPAGIGSVHAPGIGRVRAREDLVVGGTTSSSAAEGEVVLVFNSEATPVAVAFGTAPDAAAVIETGGTSAGLIVPEGTMGVPLMVARGWKINVKALS